MKKILLPVLISQASAIPNEELNRHGGVGLLLADGWEGQEKQNYRKN